jgi:hypothetical protein
LYTCLAGAQIKSEFSLVAVQFEPEPSIRHYPKTGVKAGTGTISGPKRSQIMTCWLLTLDAWTEADNLLL